MVHREQTEVQKQLSQLKASVMTSILRTRTIAKRSETRWCNAFETTDVMSRVTR